MYIDALYDRDQDTILIAERIKGQRVLDERPAEHVFYFEHGAGSHRSIFGHTCKKFSTSMSRKFHGELKRKKESGARIFESDINPVFRALARDYMGADAPKLHLCFFDIEADFHPERGYAPTEDPFNAVTGITLYLSATETLHSLVLCPPTLTEAEGRAICAEFPDTHLFTDEATMLRVFLDLIEDADVLSGWNSEGYDIPYLVNRVSRLCGMQETKRFCLWDKFPREREYIKFQKTFKTYELVGRVHLDYLMLYQKHNTQQQHSYRLDYIGEIEIGENKTVYEGTLDDLYKKDFRRFIEYNRQDVMILVKIDQKRKFIELSNQIAHANCVLLKTTTGSVALVEQAIINEMHKMGFIVPDRKPRPDDRKGPELDAEGVEIEEEGRTPVAGAYVATPKFGLNYEIGCVDINSLYPSAIRALNMSPETIFGQVRPDETMALVEQRMSTGTPRAEAWEGIFETLEVKHMQERTDAVLTVDFEDGRTVRMTGAQLHDYVFDPASHLCITANGTLFRTDKDGMIPLLLAAWYKDRKDMQKKAKEQAAKAKEATDPKEKADAQYWAGFWDQRQLARKILLNSLYGALLNEGLRFYDERVGQSTTLTGRSIDRHMAAHINQTVTGKYDYRGDAVIYCDTDSVYFSAYQVMKDDPAYAGFDWSRENIIELYDAIADAANESFPEFMGRAFNVNPTRGKLIAAGRELIASKGLFVKKKKYALLMYDKEGERLDVNGKPGKLKAMGLDLKRADTPKFMQKFLEGLLMDLLGDTSEPKMHDDIRAFRTLFKERPAWEKGSPKKVSNLSSYRDKMDKAGRVSITVARDAKAKKVTVPGHVRASLNWNRLCDMHNDRHVMRCSDGTRIIVCKLKPNALMMDSVAYPIDEPHLPDWFRDLPFDNDAMERVIIDQKIMNLVGVLKWDLSDTYASDGDEFFSFGDEPKPAMGHNGGPEWDDEDDE